MKDDAADAFAADLAAFRAAHPQVSAVEVFVTDLNGLARGKRVPIERLDKLAQGAMRIPVSTLGLDVFGQDVTENAIAIERGDPDGIMVPVPGTLAPMPWTERAGQVLCTMRDPATGAGAAYDPRSVLARVVERAAARGLTAAVALELEFYLIDARLPRPPCDPGAGTPLARDQIYEMSVMRAFEPVIDAVLSAARALGAPADTAICEFGPGQFEINLTHVEDALAAADHMVSLKRAIRGVARAQGLDASFMAKPFGQSAGSGQHVHVSLMDARGRNVLAVQGGEGAGGAGGSVAPAMRHAVAGVLAHMPGCHLISAPHANSYRRPVPGSYAPMVAAWGLDNRGVAVRVPETAGPGARLEHRVAGADANPYLLTAAVLAGALAGLEAAVEPPGPVATEAGEGDGARLPLEWDAAIRAFEASPFVAGWLGDELARVYAGLKRQERATLLSRVPDTEYDAYLRVL